jgi:hypothetical protein
LLTAAARSLPFGVTSAVSVFIAARIAELSRPLAAATPGKGRRTQAAESAAAIELGPEQMALAWLAVRCSTYVEVDKSVGAVLRRALDSLLARVQAGAGAWLARDRSPGTHRLTGGVDAAAHLLPVAAAVVDALTMSNARDTTALIDLLEPVLALLTAAPAELCVLATTATYMTRLDSYAASLPAPCVCVCIAPMLTGFEWYSNLSSRKASSDDHPLTLARLEALLPLLTPNLRSPVHERRLHSADILARFPPLPLLLDPASVAPGAAAPDAHSVDAPCNVRAVWRTHAGNSNGVLTYRDAGATACSRD